MKTPLFAAVAAAAIFATSAAPAAAAYKTAIFAGGCFWSMEKAFEAEPGVVSAVSGYAGGTMPRPTYENHRGYQEAVKVTYDPAKVSYAQLVDYYFHHIDPTDPDGMICDKGPSYMSSLFVATPEERQVAESAKAKVAQVIGARVTTTIKPTTTFYDAEPEHQDFAKRNPAHYEAYRIGCGRDRVLRVVWGGR
ncbi:MAG: peptide-methionine (S)-S-oxide reductase MsrA [Microvirga sp.]